MAQTVHFLFRFRIQYFEKKVVHENFVFGDATSGYVNGVAQGI